MKYEEKKNKLNLENKCNNINKIIDLVEINPKYNYELLSIQELKKNSINKKKYEDNFDELIQILSEEYYLKLTNKKQENQAK